MYAIRLAALITGFLWMVSPFANACDLNAATKNTRAPGYVADVQACLTNLPAGFSFDEALEQNNISRVNQERQKRGLEPLLLREDLKSPARWHSMDMAANNYFSHYEKSKRDHSDRISLLDRKLIYSVASENIAFIRGAKASTNAAELLHRGLMESDSHREAILSDEVTHMAVGVVRYENGVWLTQVFVNKMGEFLTPLPTRVSAREHLNFRLQLPGWKPGGFEAKQNKDLRMLATTFGGSALRVPDGVHGDFQLMVRGEKANKAIHSTEKNKEFLLRLTASGPIMSVAPDSYTIASRASTQTRTRRSITRVKTSIVTSRTYRTTTASAS